MLRWWAFCLISAALFSCGGQPQLASIAIKVRSSPASRNALRLFPPNQPLPDRVRVAVYRSDELLGQAVSSVDVAWSDLEEDPTTQKKYLLVNVPANEGKNYRYLLRLSSVVASEVDECGAIGQILAVKGAKKQLEVVTHPGDCSGTLCQHDGDCPDNGYCLSFECQEADPTCECPPGAYCQDSTECAADCSADDTLCNDDFLCCYGICSAHCPNP